MKKINVCISFLDYLYQFPLRGCVTHYDAKLLIKTKTISSDLTVMLRFEIAGVVLKI